MAIPKRGRRTIAVDGVEYYYKVAFDRSERAVIQSAYGTGACLFVFPFAAMKPRHVADAVHFAMSCGWEPLQNGEAHWLAFDVDADDRSYFEHIPNDDFRVLTYPLRGRISEDIDNSQFDDTRPWYLRPRPTTR
jgi:hypothetical protein